MSLRSEIIQRLVKIANGNGDEWSLVDQIRVLHDGSEAEFSAYFNSMLETITSSGTAASIQSKASRLLAVVEAEELKKEYKGTVLSSSGVEPTFELGEDDKNRMLKLATSIRKIVSASTDFDESHKVRLLNRISAMEVEIHSEKGRFDVFLGALSDFGETAGKFGKDIKPLTDRVQEMVGLARKNTPAYDKIAPPEEQEALPHPDDFRED